MTGIKKLAALRGLDVYSQSTVERDGTVYSLAAGSGGRVKQLVIQGDTAGFEDARPGPGGIRLFPLTSGNAARLRELLPWLRPQVLGLRASVGFGDRLGLATPGHVRALRRVGGDIAPLFCQQSMRENARTGRTPRQVMDDATWGVFESGWCQPWGADADHLKTVADVDICLSAGYTFFTVDPGNHVNHEAQTASEEELESKVQSLPWADLCDTPQRLHERYLSRVFAVGDIVVEYDRMGLHRSVAKYGRAVAHTAKLYHYLARQSVPFELEMSVDETETPTSVEEHLLIAIELKRLGVKWVSLAPRYIGRFEKGVDYIGNLAEFGVQLAQHAAVARTLGPYKLSIHSGSDKFSIYPAFAQHAPRLVHLKTAGTSYLEALRAIARVEPELFREMAIVALECFPQDRATYHVSARSSHVPAPEALADGELPAMLNQFDARQVFHVTFGSILDRFGPRLRDLLVANEAAHYGALEAHFVRHLEPFVAAADMPANL